MSPRNRVVLVHGFTQTAATWPAPLLERLRADGHDVVAVDAPGHGAQSDVRTGLAESAASLAARGPADFVGYSMGGRLALHVAVHHPARVGKLVLIGATAGLESEEERAARRAADEELARFLEEHGLDAFLQRWLANPLFATLPADAAGLDTRRANTVAGLAASLRLMGTGSQEPLWESLPELHHEVLFVVGERDEKFTALARRMAAAWGGPAAVEIVAGAGHAVHLERPAEVADRIAAFLHATTRAVESTSP